MRHSRTLILSGFTVAVVAALIWVSHLPTCACGQSGRRLPKAAATPAPTPAPEPAAAKPEEKQKPALKLILGADRGYMAGIPSFLTSSAVKGCVDRLDAGPNVDVTVTHRDVTRGEAIKTAKAEKEAYVVWLRLASDRMRRDNQIELNELYLEYVVYTPTTAKIATSGRTYPAGYGRGGVIMNPGGIPGRNSWPYMEQAIKQAGRAAAERILDALMAKLPPERVPG